MAMPMDNGMEMDHSKMDMSSANDIATLPMVNGEVRKVDKDTGKITIKHSDGGLLLRAVCVISLPFFFSCQLLTACCILYFSFAQLQHAG